MRSVLLLLSLVCAFSLFGYSAPQPLSREGGLPAKSTLAQNVEEKGILSKGDILWSGEDLFLNERAKKLFRELADKERVEVGTPGHMSVHYIGLGEYLLFKGGQFAVVTAQERGQEPGYLLKKIEKNRLVFDHVAANGQVESQLVVEKTPPAKIHGHKMLRFIRESDEGYEFNTLGKVISVNPEDWVLYTADSKNPEFIVLKTKDEIVDFVKGKTSGELIIFNKVIKGDHKYLTFTIYDPTRSEKKDFEIVVDKGSGKGKTITFEGALRANKEFIDFVQKQETPKIVQMSKEVVNSLNKDNLEWMKSRGAEVPTKQSQESMDNQKKLYSMAEELLNREAAGESMPSVDTLFPSTGDRDLDALNRNSFEVTLESVRKNNQFKELGYLPQESLKKEQELLRSRYEIQQRVINAKGSSNQ